MKANYKPFVFSVPPLNLKLQNNDQVFILC